MNLRDMIQMHRDEIIKVAMQHGARNIRLFGSVARGEADEKSDIDSALQPGTVSVESYHRPHSPQTARFVLMLKLSIFRSASRRTRRILLFGRSW